MLRFLQNKTSYLVYSLFVVSVVLLVYTWNTTNPTTTGPLGILVVFVLLYLFWLSLFFAVLHLGFVAMQKTGLFKIIMKRREGRPFKHGLAYYIASIVAFMPVLLLAMQSVNQLTLRDFILVFLFVVLAVFYVVKRV